MVKLVAATKNAHKLIEFRRILEPLGYEVLSQAEVKTDIDVDETGATFAENAALKAETIFRATGLATIADDSGLEVDFLDGAPGIYSARLGGPGLTSFATLSGEEKDRLSHRGRALKMMEEDLKGTK